MLIFFWWWSIKYDWQRKKKKKKELVPFYAPTVGMSWMSVLYLRWPWIADMRWLWISNLLTSSSSSSSPAPLPFNREQVRVINLPYQQRWESELWSSVISKCMRLVIEHVYYRSWVRSYTHHSNHLLIPLTFWCWTRASFWIDSTPILFYFIF